MFDLFSIKCSIFFWSKRSIFFWSKRSIFFGANVRSFFGANARSFLEQTFDIFWSEFSIIFGENVRYFFASGLRSFFASNVRSLLPRTFVFLPPFWQIRCLTGSFPSFPAAELQPPQAKNDQFFLTNDQKWAFGSPALQFFGNAEKV